MPRWNHDASTDAAAQAFRRRLSPCEGTSGAEESLLRLPGPDEIQDFPEIQGEAEAGVPVPARVRFRTSRKVAILVVVVSVLVLACFVWQAARDQTTSEPLQQSVTGAGSGGGSLQTSSANPEAVPPETKAGEMVVVHVAGAVLKPGVVSLPAGSRVYQAIEAAGGATPGAALDQLNLAEPVSDGAKVTVPVPGEVPVAGAIPEAGSPGAGGKLNINKASVDELGTLPRVGPVMAQRIADWRKEHGPFASVDELDAIEGIGPKLMESLRNLVSVNDG
ncbi:helix-hairpin-helix domain-containing protein [Paenarthrobacter sp. NPDC089675]|uniref:helix-hairpin-helix domain-containing protein n=1 Tax=Paenarthrobacter sp. NPDC089675 TaxID=3364376 RepID=UPI00382E38A0